MTSPPPTDRRSRRKTLVNVTLAGIGAFLLVLTVRRVGWAEVQAGLAEVGWWFAAILAFGGVRFAARARAWMACVEAITQHQRSGDSSPGTAHPAPGTGHEGPSTGHRAPGTRHLFGAVLASDALGNLTPLGLLASEPAKVMLVRNRLPTVTAIASVAAENAFYMASVVAMLATGAAVFISVTNLPAGLRAGVQVILVGALVSGLAAAIVARQKPAVLARLARMLSGLTGRDHSASGRLEEVEKLFYGVMTWSASAIARVVAWEAFFHLVAVAEVFLVLQLLAGSESTSLSDAFVLETTGRLITVVFKFVPYRLGVDEAGAALVAGALSIPVTAGVTLALVRRMRILWWNAVGLVILARSR